MSACVGGHSSCLIPRLCRDSEHTITCVSLPDESKRGVFSVKFLVTKGKNPVCENVHNCLFHLGLRVNLAFCFKTKLQKVLNSRQQAAKKVYFTTNFAHLVI